MTKTTKIIIVILLTLILASSVSALNLTLEKTGETYATSGTWNYNFDSEQNSGWDNITWFGDEPANTNIKFRARTASDELSLSSAAWSDYIQTSGASLNVNSDRWIEVEVHLSTTDTSATPILYNFTINYDLTSDPSYSNFTSSETTNFLDVTLSSVTSLTLAIDNKGKIAFPSDRSINSENENYDMNVKIEDAMIYVNSAALDSSFNDSAILTFEGVNCNMPYVYYSDAASTRTAILTENNQCLFPRCRDIQCIGGTLTVNVSHFSGYAVNGSASLSIDADDPKYPFQEMHFTADYQNSTGGFISGATCIINLPDGSNPMVEGTDIYTYNQTYDTAQTIEYNVSCEKAGYNTVFANDTALISGNVPEFSTITLGLGLIAVLAGLFVIRRKK